MKLAKWSIFCLLCWQMSALQAQTDSLLALAGTAANDSVRLIYLGEAFKQTLFNNPERGLIIAEDFLQVAQRSHYKEDIAMGFNFIGMSHYVQGRYDRATTFYLQSMKQAEANANERYAAIILNNIAASYEAGKQPEEAIRYFEEALRRFQRLNDQSWIAKVSSNLAQQQLMKKDLEGALRNYQLAYQTFLQLKDTHHAGLARTGFGDYYFENRQYAKALGHYEAALPMLDRQYDPSTYASQLRNLANTLVYLNRFDEAERLLKEAQIIMQDCKALEQEVKLTKVAVQLYQRKGDLPQAFAWQERYITLSDSLFNQEKAQALQDAVKKYELDKKEQQITLLNTENKVKDLGLQSARQLQLLLILGLILAALLGLGGWYLLRLKQRSHRELVGKNDQISVALAEKDLLLREIHHRVKNNLQVISSLLKLQSQHLSDQEALDALTEGRNRVQSMALIHQNLYQQEQLTAIEASTYVQKLVDALFRSYNTQAGKVQIKYEINPLLLDVDTAIPIGLILNELISNALKHAFNAPKPGLLQIRLLQDGPDALRLAVQDNGPGIDPALFEPDKPSTSFGLRLVRLLADKLEANISIRNDHGACIELNIRQFKTNKLS